MSYGIIHWGSCRHIKPLNVIQNKIYRKILSLGNSTKESEIYNKMKVAKLENVYKICMSMFVFHTKKSEVFFLNVCV